MDRRDFIRLSALSGCAMAMGGPRSVAASDGTAPVPPKTTVAREDMRSPMRYVCKGELHKDFHASILDGVPPFIVGSIADSARFEFLNPHFAKAFGFLRSTDLKSLADGKIEIDGDNVFAYVSSPELTPFDKEGESEVHRKYIDIHAPIVGEETIGTFTMTDKELALPFNEKDDYVLFKAKGEPVTLRRGEFIAFFPPYGAHRPGCTMAKVPPKGYRKICVKVKVEK